MTSSSNYIRCENSDVCLGTERERRLARGHARVQSDAARLRVRLRRRRVVRAPQRHVGARLNDVLPLSGSADRRDGRVLDVDASRQGAARATRHAAARDDLAAQARRHGRDGERVGSASHRDTLGSALSAKGQGGYA